MRFNNKELASLSHGGEYDKEGQLWMKDKQDKLFKKGEAYVKRLLRLKGNLLFYFKDKDVIGDPVGVLVIERCTVELDLNVSVDNGFLIVYEGDDYMYKFQANSEQDRDDWIQVLHTASYECLKMQLLSLREQIQARTGRDPITQPPPTETGMDYETQSGNTNDDPAMEICIACEDLPNDSSGQAPNPFVVLNTIVPPQQTWVQHNNTEVVEMSNNPQFLKTIGFGDTTGLDTSTRVKMTVYHVKERITGTMSHIGQTIFTLQDLLLDSKMNIRLNLQGPDHLDCGKVTIMAWINDQSNLSLNDNKQSHSEEESRKLKRRSKRVDTLRPMYNNIITRTFRFDTTDKDVKLLVHEYMGESRLTFDIPGQLLRLWIDEENRIMTQLQELGQLPESLEGEQVTQITISAATVSNYTDLLNNLAEYSGLLDYHQIRQYRSFEILSLCKTHQREDAISLRSVHEGGTVQGLQLRYIDEAQDYCMSMLAIYTQHINFLSSFKGPCFKASVRKGDKELEFVPINLHLQRMTVINEQKNTTGWYDNITVGAFTAYAQKFRNGGLRRLLQHVKDIYAPDSTLSKVTKLDRAVELINSIYDLKVSITQDCDKLCHIAIAGSPEELKASMDTIAEKVRDLVQICDTPMLQKSADEYQQLKMELNSDSPEERSSVVSVDSRTGSGSADDLSPEKSWKWTGSNFVKSPTFEPWEMTRLNTEATVVCLVSMVDELVKNRTGSVDRPKLLDDISPTVIKLKSFLELVYHRASLFMTFLNVKETKGSAKLLHTVKYRRDVCFSHALTSLVTGFVTNLNTNISNPTFFDHISKVGVLAQFEGLLSCHGDEMGMIEDMVVAVDDLSQVTFQITRATEADSSPIVSLDGHFRKGSFADLQRHGVCVCIPVQEELFEHIPECLQNGQKIKVCPVIFNMGINESASLAEKFGDISLQERVNAENVAKVFLYIEAYQKEIGDPDDGKTGPGTIGDLTKKLHYNTMTKKSKNTEILRLASEICRKLNGIRFTSCKSAKDRTSMSVTLEQVYILQQEHDLASHVFNQALDCFRSEGVRRENTLKNIGSRKYAFNSFQLLYVPKLYRPPNGTYGNVQG